jgi:hypothetical protein
MTTTQPTDSRRSPLSYDCPKCKAKPGEPCRGDGKLSNEFLDYPHRQRVPAPSKPVWDERQYNGVVLNVMGGIFWLIAGFGAYIAQRDAKDSGLSIADANFAPAIGLFGFGCFLLLLGVILIAGAQRVDR